MKFLEFCFRYFSSRIQNQTESKFFGLLFSGSPLCKVQNQLHASGKNSGSSHDLSSGSIGDDSFTQTKHKPYLYLWRYLCVQTKRLSSFRNSNKSKNSGSQNINGHVSNSHVWREPIRFRFSFHFLVPDAAAFEKRKNTDFAGGWPVGGGGGDSPDTTENERSFPVTHHAQSQNLNFE